MSSQQKEGSLWRVCMDRILDLYEKNPEATFNDTDIEEWLQEDRNSEAYTWAWLSVYQALKKNHDIWLIRVRNTGYKIANDQERMDVIYQRKCQAVVNALTEGIGVLAGINRSALATDKQSDLDSKQQKSAFQLQAFLQIQRAKQLSTSLSLEICQPDHPKLFCATTNTEVEDNG